MRLAQAASSHERLLKLPQVMASDFFDGAAILIRKMFLVSTVPGDELMFLLMC
jgi:hypothetical protein